MRLLQNKWDAGTHWPKRLEYLELAGLRGWTGQRLDFRFPITAICGENGSGKSSILQAAAAAYASTPNIRYAGDFFPDTTWETITDAWIKIGYREGPGSQEFRIHKPTLRWRRNPDRPKRPVVYVDLTRIQPISAKTGYARLAKNTWKETRGNPFDAAKIARISNIMGRKYESGRLALTSGDAEREIPVLRINGKDVSAYHQGAGEFTLTELLNLDPPKYSLVLIDELETSLHPRAQRKLMRDLAEVCLEKEIQVILSTHSPYVLEELPPLARAYILRTAGTKEIVAGVSPEFAMAKMDEQLHPECDVYVEDQRSATMLREILVANEPELVSRIQMIIFGAANVGVSLGQMISKNRFPRPSIALLDGDQPAVPGCLLLPGEDAPEIVVFNALSESNWLDIHTRVGRSFASVSDECSRAMLGGNHHDWLRSAGNILVVRPDALWEAMCAEWATKCLTPEEAKPIIDAVRLAIHGEQASAVASVPPPLPEQSLSVAPPSESQHELFRLSSRPAVPEPQPQDFSPASAPPSPPPR